jgi:arabinan endo-1,5-alpha-L-arabinosidase
VGTWPVVTGTQATTRGACLTLALMLGCEGEGQHGDEQLTDARVGTVTTPDAGALDASPPVASDAAAPAAPGASLDAAPDGAVPGSPDAGRTEDGGPRPSDAGASDAASERCAPSSPAPAALPLRGDLGTHDPVIIESEGQYFLFATGRGVQTKRSSDLLSWQRGSPVFAQNPAWINQRVPGATDLWAPDISHFGGAFHLYYSASTFGSNRSCIGHATRASLTTGSWQDRGAVICSNESGARDDWNAIDPNVALDAKGTPWLTFGSFWSGLKQIKLTNEGARADAMLLAVAGRPNGGAIEAPFVLSRCGEYYLFVSFDACCKGADSTYRIMVGRARSIDGPYLDRAGVALTRGGGTPLLQGDARWRGPGHNAVLRTANGDYNVYHAYAAADGHSELRISELAWDDAGWPVSAGP